MADLREPCPVSRLGFAPLKGSRHLAHDEITLDRWGPVGDRDWCLVDLDKQRVLRTIDTPLLRTTVVAHGDRLRVTLADGMTAEGVVGAASEPLMVDYWGRRVEVTPYDGEPARLLARHVGRPVQLARAERGGVVYGAPVSLLGTASLRDLAARMQRPELASQPERFRSTVVVQTDEPWVEDSWLGRDLAMGESVVRVNERIGRCGVPNRHPVTGAADASILQALASFRPTNHAGEPCFGVDAVVLTPGRVRVSDLVQPR